jgi:hypothetical protein
MLAVRVRYTRILLLNSSERANYPSNAIKALCDDVAVLLEHGVDVVLGLKTAARAVEAGDLERFRIRCNDVVEQEGWQNHTIDERSNEIVKPLFYD